ncbi:MAG: class I SAM-dependent methyltransferase [Gammaproteobacteria bacterium]|nr:class I SAM-dependent methyltransferase [Gammaproteobacteria bacterium]MBU1647642.1 class I SAM-dependent methyltransferase [Gammaproteobacteria bacterium]MBU1971529.1 class I SAM-dependent methyltransferase [Gammaproteobacteria bacterium]
MSFLQEVLGHPLTRGLAVDDPRTTLLRHDIIQGKAFLRALYAEWYERICGVLDKKNDVLELGSGAGFLQQFLPGAITSEVFETPGVKLIASACNLPLKAESLDAIVMTDVFHHIPDVGRFLAEAARCVRPGGKLVMIEPWRTAWSEWVYTHLHSEPFSPESGWEIPNTGPLSGANGALPWIVFQRDRALFEARFPQWHINNIEPMMAFTYLLSSGVSMRSFLPGWMYRPVRTIERVMGEKRSAMFALIELELE